MNNEEYKQYLKSDKWKRIVQKRLEIDGFRCVICGCKGTQSNPLTIHHLSYKHIGKEDEQDHIYTDLATLCNLDHASVHKLMDRVTSRTGRRGWSENHYIPSYHVFTINGADTDKVTID